MMCYRKLVYLLVLFFLKNSLVHAQNDALDSVTSFENFQHLTTKYLQAEQPDSVLFYAHLYEKKWLSVTPKTNAPKNTHRWLAEIYATISRAWQLKGDTQQAEKTAQKALDFALLQYGKNAVQLHPYYSRIGQLYYQTEEYDLSRDYYKKSIFVLKQDSNQNHVFKDKNSILAHYYSLLGLAYAESGWGNLAESLKCFRLSQKYIQGKPQGVTLRIDNFKNIGDVFIRKREFEVGLSYILKADSIWQACYQDYQHDPDFQRLQAEISFSRGYYWKGKGHRQKAIFYLRKSIQITEQYPTLYHPTKGLSPLMHISEIYGGYSQQFSGEQYQILMDSAIFFTQKALFKKTFFSNQS